MENGLMKIFEQIKDGVIPDRKIIFELLNSNYKEENTKEIKKYIEILEDAYGSTTSISEKVLINDVIFILRLISTSKKDAIYDYLDNFLTLNIHKISDKDVEFFDEIIEVFGVDLVIEYINNRLLIIDSLDKESLRSFFNWILHKIWTAKSFFNNYKFMLLYANAKSLLYKLIEQNRIDEVMYLEFFIYHIMGNNYQTQKEWKKFNEEINKVCANFYAKYAQTHNLEKPNPTKKDKIRIAFIRDRLVNNSPFMVEYSLLKALQENKAFTDKYEIAIYSMNYFEKQNDDPKIVQKFLDIGIPVISPAADLIKDRYYNNHLEKALIIRKTLIEDDIDIMIGCVSSYDIMGFLFTTRSAPIQIYWSHGNCSYDVPGIDKRISHFEQNCKEFEWNIFNVPIADEFLIGNEKDKKDGEKIKNFLLEKFGKDTVILGTIGRLVKIESEEYIKTLSEIMKQNPNTIYLACGNGNQENVEKLMSKYDIDLKRVVFTGQVNPHMCGWVIDVWPDSFPLRQGQSKNEYSAKGGVVIYMDEYLNDTIRNWYKNFKIKPFANSIDEYVGLVTEMINNLEKRKKLSDFNRTIFSDKSVDSFIGILND
jgi:hypothetical protein